ncbi:MAG: GGDEF domain-containing protein [Sulfurimonas sp.]|nr:GGDEF domain-containing protein [Sulfurimonas sp.]
MENLDEKKKVKSFYLFLLITAIPVVGVAVIFLSAYFHIQGEIKFASHELKGLKVVEQIDKTIFSIQKIRGLVCVKEPNSDSLERIESLKKEINSNLAQLKVVLIFMDNNTASHITFKDELIEFVVFVENSSLELLNFKQITQIVSKFMSFSNRAAYEDMLVLEPDLNSFVLVNNVVFLLPELIEYNGHIRAVASNMKEGSFTIEQKQHMVVELEKIQENLSKLDYNMGLLKKISQNSHFEATYEKMLQVQKKIIEFTQTQLLKEDTSAVEPNGIYVKITQSIDFIIDLHSANLNILRSKIENKLEDDTRISIHILLGAIGFILFIIFVNRVFYLKTKKYIEKIEELTITDAMTGLYNRRYFDKVFEDSLRVQQRTNQLLVFIMLDIDFFKQYNDTYGHQAGDEAIKCVSKQLKLSLKRAGDMAFRLGGEEFGILCVGINEAEVLTFANGIKTNIENEQIKHKHSKVSGYLTISMGVIIVKAGYIESASHMYKCADKALYAAKENGRNRVSLYDAEAFCGIE